MKMIGLGRLGRDAELRRTSSGDAVLELALAYNYGRKGDDGNRPSQWIKGTMWGTRAEALASSLVKGQQIVVTLSDVHIETYKKRDGTSGLSLVARVDDVEFAGTRPASGQQSPQAPRQQAAAPRQAAPQQRQQDGRNQSQGRASSGFDDMDDDIPW